MKKLTFFLFAFQLLFSPVAFSQIKQRTDEQGIIHFYNDSPVDPNLWNNPKKLEKFIGEMHSAGIFLKIELGRDLKGNQGPVVYVGRRFYDLLIEDKGRVVAVVWRKYWFTNSDLTGVAVMDGYTGKQIGKYQTKTGFELF